MLRTSAKPVRVLTVLALVLATTRFVLAVPPATAAQDGFQAAGSPILPGCADMQNTVNRLKAGLPLQNEWIKRSEDQLRSAEEGVRGSQEELQNMALKAATDLATRQLDMIRDMKAGIAKAAASNATRQKWLDRVDRIRAAAEKVDQAQKLGKAGVEGNQLGAAIAQNRAQLVDFIKFVNEAGISDDLGLKAAEFAGPAGVAVVETFTVARDVLYATFQGKMSADEADVHRKNLDAMRNAKADVETRIYELNTDLASTRCTPTPKPEDRMGIKKDPEPAPPAPAATATPKDKQQKTPPSAAKLLGTLVVAGGVGVGTYYYLDKALNKVEGTGTGGGSSSVKATFNTSSVINCTFNAGGIINSCTGTVTIDFTGSVKSGTTYRFQFDAGPGGNRTISSAGSVPFTITGGTGSQTCPTLRTGGVIETSSQLVIASFSNMPITVSCK